VGVPVSAEASYSAQRHRDAEEEEKREGWREEGKK
jgi:hypothetical protein